MSLLPEQILPQTVPIGTAQPGGQVIMDPNWWLFFYNLGQEVLGVNGSTPTGVTPLLFDTPLPDPLTAQTIGQQLYPITKAEISASVTPTDYAYPPGHVFRYGAVGNGVADDTAALQDAVNANGIAFCVQRGLIFKTSAAIAVPTTCYYIDLQGCMMEGPGAAGAVDAFYFTGFYQGAGSITFNSNRYRLPGMANYRYAVNLTAAAFINIESDLIQFCTDGVHVDSTSANLQYCVELDIDIKNISKCTNGFNMLSHSGSGNGIQGCHFKSNYVNGCTNAIAGTFDTSSAIFTFNYFDITVLDGAGASGTSTAINYNLVVNASANFYRFPGDVIDMTATPSPYVNVGVDSDFEILHFRGGFVMDYFAWTNFVPQQPKPVTYPGFSNLEVYVSTTGSDTTGDGSSGAPYATVNHALSLIQQLDCMGQNVTILLDAGTYSGSITYDTTTQNDPNAQIIIQPNSSAAVILTGGISILGPCAKVLLQVPAGSLTIETAGLVAQYGATVNISGVTFGAASGATHMIAQNGALINMSGNYTISGGANIHIQTSYGGCFTCLGQTVTLTGTPAFGTYFAYSEFSGSNQDWTGSSFSGSATGTRYDVILNAVINTTGGGATFLPGSVGGGSSSGGQYA